ncbi:MAG: TrbI/VirB10 family protein [Caulobacter sp.]
MTAGANKDAARDNGQDKVPPEALSLRVKPRPTVRFRRGLIIAAVAVGATGIAAASWFALSPKSHQGAKAPDEPAVDSQRGAGDIVADLPRDYGGPQLGPPLPGDLGRAVLDHQRASTLAGSKQPIKDEPTTRAQQAAEAESQRLAGQASQAREAGVMVQGASRSLAENSVAGASSATAAPLEAPSAPTVVAGASQDARRAFLERAGPASTVNAHQLVSPASPYQVMAGSIIAASLITGLNSDLPGQVVAQVTEPVYDSATGSYLLIPQGSRLIGMYDSVVAFGQSRALLVWQRLILPDASSIELDNLPATDAAGYAGIADQVDFHTWRLLRGIGLSTLFGVGSELSLNDESDLVRAIRQSAQQSATQAGQQIIARQLDVQPTIKVRPGWPLRVVVHKDLVLRPWRR